MPYIPENERVPALTKPQTPGELTYTITMLIDEYLDPTANDADPNFERLSSVVGVLECVKLEFYTRLIAAYENAKIEQNGDVFSVDLLRYLESGGKPPTP